MVLKVRNFGNFVLLKLDTCTSINHFRVYFSICVNIDLNDSHHFPIYYCPQTKLRKGNVFRSVCQSTGGGGGLCQGRSLSSGLCPWGSLSWRTPPFTVEERAVYKGCQLCVLWGKLDCAIALYEMQPYYLIIIL